MKETTRTIQIKAYTDNGTPICGDCIILNDIGHCEFDGTPLDLNSTPGPLCPVWHGESKTIVKILKD